MGGSKDRFAPLEPSCLRLLSGPVSPASPTTPHRPGFPQPALPSPRSATKSSSLSLNAGVPAAPPPLMPWIWSCHKCHSRYALGATRRCLHDGHYFCGGVTVGRNGKLRRHTACVSEFDYLGWEEFGTWRGKARGCITMDLPAFKHCESQCDFPSACRWKAKLSPKKERTFVDFLDQASLGSECLNNAPATEEKKKETTSVPKKTSVFVNKLVKAAEKRTSQLTTLLSNIEDESNFALTPGYIPAPRTVEAPPKLSSSSSAPKLPELKLSFPVMDFSTIKNSLDKHHKIYNGDLPNIPEYRSPKSPPIEASAWSNAADKDENDNDVQMSDWLSASATAPSPLPKTITVLLPTEVETADFDFNIADSSSSSSDDDSLPNSPRKTAWEWTAGAIGIALESPAPPSLTGRGKERCEGSWDEMVGEEIEDVEMMWEGAAERRGSMAVEGVVA